MLCAGVIVVQKADTLQFMDGDTIIQIHILAQDSTRVESGYVVHIQQTKVSDKGDHYILYDEYRNSSVDSLTTTLSLYTSMQHMVWIREYSKGRRIDFEKTKIYDDKVTITTTDRSYGAPVLELITNNASLILIEQDQWQRLVDYAFSPNMRFVTMHVRNPFNRKMWDYIYFIDRKTQDTWTYQFPICISCKRNRITVSVDDEGNSEIVYKEQHRVFDTKGSLKDFFMRL